MSGAGNPLSRAAVRAVDCAVGDTRWGRWRLPVAICAMNLVLAVGCVVIDVLMPAPFGLPLYIGVLTLGSTWAVGMVQLDDEIRRRG